MVDDRAHLLHGEGHAVVGHVGHFRNVVAGAEGDVGVHLLHAGEFELAEEFVLALVRATEQFAGDGALVNLHERERLRLADGAHERDGHLGGQVEGVDEHAFALLETGREAAKLAGQLVVARVGHGAKIQRLFTGVGNRAEKRL